MLDHARIWQAIDRLARERGLSASGLARRAGLDPTTFNKSKRLSREGKPRWPSTESLARILGATGASLTEFAAYAETENGGWRGLPRAAFAEAERPGRFDERGRPTGSSWAAYAFPALADSEAFALGIESETTAPPLKSGDVVIVSPRAEVVPGDRVVVRTKAGRLALGILRGRSPTSVEVGPLDGTSQVTQIPAADVHWVARILWASQ